MSETLPELMQLLTEARDTRQRGTEDRDYYIRRAAALGAAKKDLAAAAGLSRRGVYDVLERESS